MWESIARFIFRYRIYLLGLVMLSTLFFGYFAHKVELLQEFAKVVPASDPDFIDFQWYKKTFGDDANSLIFLHKGKDAFSPSFLSTYSHLLEKVERINGVKSIATYAKLFTLTYREDSLYLAECKMDCPYDSLPVYANLLLDSTLTWGVTLVQFESEVISTKKKHVIIPEVIHLIESHASQYHVSLHYTGIPYLRIYISKRLPKELFLFVSFALLLTALSLYFFYRDFYSVLFPLLLLAVSSISTLGIIGLLGYKITLLSGLLPPIIIILGIPPSIYMISDYHDEFIRYRNKYVALQKMVKKLGLVTLMINANTAFSFLTLYFTEVVPLQEFGIVAFLGTMLTYVYTLILIPGVFSLLPSPKEHHVQHLNAKWMKTTLDWIAKAVLHKRSLIYAITAIVIGISIWGLTKLEAVSYMMDDIPKQKKIYQDLIEIESTLNGSMPLEIVFDSGKKNGFRSHKNMEKIAKLQDSLAFYPELARSLSYVDLVKWVRQAVYNNDPSQYTSPIRDEMPVIWNSLRHSNLADQVQVAQLLVDSTGQYIRISTLVKDIGSQRVSQLIEQIKSDVQEIWGPDSLLEKQGQRFLITGTTRLFLKSNEYLLDNLIWSLLAAFFIIGLQMFFLYNSFRIMLISMIPNLIPLALTAAFMGFMKIPLKPSTALIYEMAFGIAIDNSIHYLATYRFRRKDGLSISHAVQSSLRITGLGIIYTSIVLFFGFGIFIPSEFGSTQALGMLTAITLLIALFSNLFLMPALIIDWDREKMPEHALIDEEYEEM